MKLPLQFGTAVLACLWAATTSPAQTRTFTSQYTFGDSLSDNGNLYALTGRTQPPSPYYNGRFSNGPVFTELLGNPIAPAAAISAQRGNLDFAFGGATTTGGVVPSLAVQIGMYRQQGLPAAKTDLFTVLAGANDMIAILGAPSTAANPASVEPAAATVAQSVATSVQALVGLGAKNIVVGGLPNLGATPRSVAAGSSAASVAQRASVAYNNELRSQLRQIATAAPDVNLVFVDLQGIIDRVVLDYRALGYSNATSYALATSALTDPNSFVFWDDIHPTAKTHALLASVILEELNPEPVLGFAATEGTAALALGGLTQSAIDDRVSQLFTSNRTVGRMDAFAAFNYGDANRAGDGWRQKFSYHAQVVTAGVDMRVSEGMFGGVAFNAGHLRPKLRANAGSYSIDDVGGQLYGVWTGGPVALSVEGGYSNLRLNSIHRTTALGGFQTNGKTTGDHWNAGLKVMWTGLQVKTLGIMPWLGLSTSRVTLHGYNENGVPSLSMGYASQRAISSPLSAGVDLVDSIVVAGYKVRLSARGAWHGEVGSRTRDVTGQLVDNVTRPTTITLADGDGSGVELGGAATLFFAKNWSASLGYAGDIRAREKLASRATFAVQTGF